MNISITISTDDNYCMHASSLVLSILENSNPVDFYKFYIFYSTSGLSSKNIEKLHKIFEEFNCELIFKELKDIFTKFKCDTKHLNSAAYYRLISLDRIPEKRVIYLDIDTIVESDMRELYNFDLEGKAVGAVSDYIVGVRGNEDYFNSGVLLVDLDKWKSQNYSKKSLDYLEKNAKKLKFADQDALTHVFYGKWKKLPLRFNRQKIIHEFSNSEMKLSKKEYDKLLKFPSIIHYTGPRKPWHFKYVFPDKKNYIKYIEKTPWKNEINKDISIKSGIFFVLRWLVYKLRLRNFLEKSKLARLTRYF